MYIIILLLTQNYFAWTYNTGTPIDDVFFSFHTWCNNQLPSLDVSLACAHVLTVYYTQISIIHFFPNNDRNSRRLQEAMSSPKICFSIRIYYINLSLSPIF